MTAGWKTVPLGELLTRTDRFEDRDDWIEYPFAGTYSFARGIFVGERKLGSSFKLPKIQRIKVGDFVYCKIMAWEGAFGLVPDEADDCVMSGAFVAYEIDTMRLEPRFLDLYFKIPKNWKGLGGQSSGTNVRRQSLHPAQFEAHEIPLPPLAEQRRIVARIEALAAEIAEAKRLRQEAVAEAEAMCRAIITQDSDSKPTPMSELVRMRPSDVAVQSDETYQFAGVYCFGRGVFRSVTKTGMEFAYPRLTRLEKGNFVYPKLMAWEGALGVVPEECDGMVVSTEFPVFEVLTDRVFPEVLDIHFKNPAVWPELSGSSTGTNVRRRRLNPGDFLKYRFPLPPRPVQETVRKVKAEVNAMNRLQSETAAELDALLPAILDRAFKGEL